MVFFTDSMNNAIASIINTIAIDLSALPLLCNERELPYI
jgi:hypothetical protein